jgi:hypothetical protein
MENISLDTWRYELFPKLPLEELIKIGSLNKDLLLLFKEYLNQFLRQMRQLNNNRIIRNVQDLARVLQWNKDLNNEFNRIIQFVELEVKLKNVNQNILDEEDYNELRDELFSLQSIFIKEMLQNVVETYQNEMILNRNAYIYLNQNTPFIQTIDTRILNGLLPNFKSKLEKILSDDYLNNQNEINEVLSEINRQIFRILLD